MSSLALAQGVIDALPDPAFLLDGDGGVIAANAAARRLLGRNEPPAHVADIAVPDADARPPRDQPGRDAAAQLPAGEAAGGATLARYLARCRQTTVPIPSALPIATADGVRRFQVRCSRLSGLPDEVVLLLRLLDPRDDRFAVLSERVRQLDAELRQRAREKAVLREALDENRNLMRELQHRVKNNIQMMISLLSMSASRGPAEVREFVDVARNRFRALATTQDLIYQAQSGSVIPARQLLEALTQTLAESTGSAATITSDIADVRVPQESAHCLALIVNELVTNSIKHGRRGEGATISISLRRASETLRLEVRDDGPGYPDAEALPRSSGLTLIRGLCRQIGGALELANDGGARTTVTFADAFDTASADPEEGAPEPRRERHSDLDSRARAL